MEPDNSPQLNPQPQQPAPPAPTDQAWLPLPTEWPGAFKIYKVSKQAVRLNLEAIIVYGLLGLVLGYGLELALKTYGQLLAYIIGSLSTAILTSLYIAGVRQQRLDLGAAFSKGLKFWLKIFLLNLLVTLTVGVSLLLLIVPFFFVWPRMVLVNYFLVDKDMGVIEAYKASWQATKGNVSKIYGIVGANAAMALLVFTIIGIPFAIYFLVMYSAANAVLYEMILRHETQPGNNAAPVAMPPPAVAPTN
ncbi:MAG TPA: hypothetical protein VH234_01340 [Candidatus Saccharimonadales bacterium]|jgi:hypothetical protein|nr:hypothetical protein [Candidatus Saccharimonadales bacterium]